MNEFYYTVRKKYCTFCNSFNTIQLIQQMTAKHKMLTLSKMTHPSA